jgi:predicted DNA-binding antitoxin AbrB/MazE fold protein
MGINVEALYEKGVLRPAHPLPLQEHEKVRLAIQIGDSPLLRAYGIMGWKGDPEILRRLALSPTFDLEGE